MTTTTLKDMFQGAVPTSAGSAEYTVPGATNAILKSMDFCNTTGQIITLRLHLCLSGATADTTNAIFYDFPIYPSSQGGGLSWEGEKVMATGDFIQAIASASGLVAFINGVEFA